MIVPLFGALPLLFTLRAGITNAGATCDIKNPCNVATPCCSEFGFCGVESFCLGGCNPLTSHTLTSCMPEPVCKDAVYTFQDNSRILSNATYYNGNASQYDWVLDKGNIFNTNKTGGELALTLTETNGGTRISSTRYLHYGTITARLKTGRWAGVVTAFITMSDIRDEIDWEFPGNTTLEGQTNFFWQGYVPDKTNGQTVKVPTDTYQSYHDYTIDWQPQALTFLIDGQVVQTVNQADTVDASGVHRFPSTPSRIQLSLWPAGIASSPRGTIQWSGGMIDWKDPDYLSAGHFAVYVDKVTVKCADPKPPGINMTSYRYGANTTLQTPSIFFSNETTIINGAPLMLGTMSLRLQCGLGLATGLLLAYLL